MNAHEPSGGYFPPPLPDFTSCPPEKPWHQRPGIAIILVIVGIVIAGRTIEWIQKATTDERAQLIDIATSQGFSTADAVCFADRIEERFGNVADIPETREGLTATLEAMIGCRGDLVGVPSVISACIVDAMAVHFLSDADDIDELVAVANDLDGDGKRFIMMTSLTCQGASDAAAECVVDTMVEQVDPELFERDNPDLTTGELAALQQIRLRCERTNA